MSTALQGATGQMFFLQSVDGASAPSPLTLPVVGACVWRTDGATGVAWCAVVMAVGEAIAFCRATDAAECSTVGFGLSVSM
jgi:hypothetical protein